MFLLLDQSGHTQTGRLCCSHLNQAPYCQPHRLYEDVAVSGHAHQPFAVTHRQRSDVALRSRAGGVLHGGLGWDNGDPAGHHICKLHLAPPVATAPDRGSFLRGWERGIPTEGAVVEYEDRRDWPVGEAIMPSTPSAEPTHHS
jgi:hypothetical protein